MFIKVFIITAVTCLTLSTSDITIDDDAEGSPLSQTCLRCICKIMGCKKEEGCIGNVCGVFHITYGYWQKAHDKSDNATVTEYQDCTNNVWCATRTVQRYMRKYLPGCELKRPERLRCENALALHKLGLNSCHKNLTAIIRSKLTSCLGKLTWKWLEMP